MNADQVDATGQLDDGDQGDILTSDPQGDAYAADVAQLLAEMERSDRDVAQALLTADDDLAAAVAGETWLVSGAIDALRLRLDAAADVVDQADELDQVDEPVMSGADVLQALKTLRSFVAARPAQDTPDALYALTIMTRLVAASGDLLPPAAVAARLGVSISTVRRLIGSGDLVARRLGHHTVRVPAASLAGYLARLAAKDAPATRSAAASDTRAEHASAADL